MRGSDPTQCRKLRIQPLAAQGLIHMGSPKCRPTSTSHGMPHAMLTVLGTVPAGGAGSTTSPLQTYSNRVERSGRGFQYATVTAKKTNMRECCVLSDDVGLIYCWLLWRVQSAYCTTRSHRVRALVGETRMWRPVDIVKLPLLGFVLGEPCSVTING